MKLKFSEFCTILLLVIIQRVAGSCIGNIFNSHSHGEVEYKLGKNKLFGQEISSNKLAERFQIGSSDSLDSVGSRKDRATCTRLMADKYKDAFRPKIRQVNPNNIAYINDLGENFYIYFVFLGKEVWECTGGKKGSEFKFYRIVNVIQGTSEIYKLYYVDGVQVLYRFQLPAIKQSQFLSLRSTKAAITSVVREIKYLDIKDLNKPLKFEGTIELSHADEKFSMFEALYVDEFRSQVDIHTWLQKGETRTSTINSKPINEGERLLIGKTWSEEIGSSADQATCNRIDVDGNESSKFLPDVTIYSSNGKNGHETPTLILDDLFVVAKHEIWNCEITRTKETFTRVETDLIGRGLQHENMQDLFYYDGISVWKFRLNDKNDYSAKIKSVHYSKTDNPKLYLKYTGKLNLLTDHTERLINSAEYTVKYTASTDGNQLEGLKIVDNTN